VAQSKLRAATCPNDIGGITFYFLANKTRKNQIARLPQLYHIQLRFAPQLARLSPQFSNGTTNKSANLNKLKGKALPLHN
jgi:hypothetical protein